MGKQLVQKSEANDQRSARRDIEVVERIAGTRTYQQTTLTHSPQHRRSPYPKHGHTSSSNIRAKYIRHRLTQGKGRKGQGEEGKRAWIR